MGSLWHPFSDMGAVETDGEFVIARGEGVHVYDRAGTRYLDATAGLWFTNVGHGREELAEATQLPLQHVEEALDAAQANVSLNQTVGGENDGELGDLFADQTSADPSDEAADSYRRHLVRKAVGRLPEREARIVSLRFGLDGEPQSLEAIGKEVGLTRERVRQLETQAFARLQNELAGIADELADAA